MHRPNEEKLVYNEKKLAYNEKKLATGSFSAVAVKVGSSNPSRSTDLEKSALRIPLGLCSLIRLTQPNDWKTVTRG